MRTNSSNEPSPSVASDAPPLEAGFTMLEMVVALVILMVGLLAMASTIGYGLMASNRGRNVTNTKLLIVSVLEQMETLRNTRQLTFGQIANAAEVDNQGALQDFAGFPADFQPISMNPGPDGITGTDDDLVDLGPDGISGTDDDFLNPELAYEGFTRQIEITPLSDNLKKIQVTLRYPGPSGEMQTLEGTSYLNNDARSNFLR